MIEFGAVSKCVHCGHKQELKSYMNRGSSYFAKCNNCNEYYGIDMPENEKLFTERVLNFQVASDNKHTEIGYAVDIACKLIENNIDYVCYLNSGSSYRPEFYVRRSGKTWNDVMHVINTVKAPVYKYGKITFHTTNINRDGVLGNLQPVTVCN